MLRPHQLSVLVLAFAAQACSTEPATFERPAPAPAPAAQPVTAAPAAPAAPTPTPQPPWFADRLPPAPRIVAIGDVHGDLRAFRAALRAGGVLDAADHWSGAETVVVQTGDVFDRGDDELEIVQLIDRLRPEAAAAGGKLVTLNGNHELMNVALDFRYVTPGAYADFDAYASADPALADVKPEARGRVAAFKPGGPLALALSRQNMVQVVGDTLFLHGGLEPRWAQVGLEALNDGPRRWMTGELPQAPESVTAHDSPTWSRAFSAEESPEVCDALARSLDAVGARRMVVGHTVQRDGITSACDGRVWRIDVGMAAYYGGQVQVLEITGAQTRLLGPTTE